MRRMTPEAFSFLHGALWRGAVCMALTLLAFPPTPAGAQSREDAAREIERTDRVLERAREVVSSSETDLAIEYLEQAIKLQNLARSAVTVGRFGDAIRLTRQARDRAYTAVRIAEQTGSAEFLRFMMERTDAILDRVAPIVRESSTEVAQRMLDAALEQQRRSRDALASGRPRAALSLTIQARERAMRALRLAEAAEGQLPERAARVVERTEGLLADAGWLAEAGGKAARSYGLALRTQSQARIRLESGEYPAALRLSQRAREQLVRALSEADRPLQREAVVQSLERTRRLVERAAETAGDEPQREALRRAQGHLRRAEQDLERDDLAACLAEIRAARGILDRAGLP